MAFINNHNVVVVQWSGPLPSLPTLSIPPLLQMPPLQDWTHTGVLLSRAVCVNRHKHTLAQHCSAPPATPSSQDLIDSRLRLSLLLLLLLCPARPGRLESTAADWHSAGSREDTDGEGGGRRYLLGLFIT